MTKLFSVAKTGCKTISLAIVYKRLFTA